ncbi:MAG TPA: iron-containing alcohol dehydrogenase [Verrucomicrobiae bacterium]|nr:iron-containing alcohol dehydrogenase [Verrucomicrobiae bacterium]
MKFEFATATRIVFGAGRLGETGKLARELGTSALVVTGRDMTRARRLEGLLNKEGIRCALFPVAGEPDLGTVDRGVAEARRCGCDLVLSLGGGSAIDAGKAIAAMITNEGVLLDYLEVIGKGKALARVPAPFIAIPTTAGTGSEVTRNAVLASPAHRVKVSLRSIMMLPRVALVDPELAYGLPPAVTASTGLDALTQLIEPYVCSRPNPITDAICEDGMRRVSRSLRRAFADGNDADAREDMAVASLFGGIALANAGLGAVHGFAGPIGGMFPAPHGAVCAALLPHVMEMNLRALDLRMPGSETGRRYREVAQWLTGEPNATAIDGVEWVGRLVAELRIPQLKTYGLRNDDIGALVQKAMDASSMKANPIALTEEELAEVLGQAI